MAHIIICLNKKKEERCLKITHTLSFIFLYFLVEAIKEDDKEIKYKEELLDYYTELLNGTKWIGNTNFMMEEIWNRDIINWYGDILNNVLSLINNRSEELHRAYLKKIPNYSTMIKVEQINGKLISLTNDMKWILQIVHRHTDTFNCWVTKSQWH